MSLSASDIAAVVQELALLRGGHVQKVYAPSPRAVVLEVRVPGATHLLLLSAEPDETRLHATRERPPSPPTPHPFQNLLRARAVPARLAALEVIPGDRVVRLALDGAEGRRVLWAELTGRHGNLLLTDEAGHILGTAAPGASSRRPLVPGVTYEPPAPHPREQPRRFTGGAGELPLSRAVEEAYGPASRERALAALRREAGKPLTAALRRVHTALARIEQEEQGARGAEEQRRLGDLLKTVLHQARKGALSVAATEYSESGVREVSIPLAPELSPHENLDRYYRRYRRLTAAAGRIAARRAELLAQRARLEALSARLSSAGSEAELQEVARAAVSAGARAQGGGRKAVQERRLPYREYRTRTGQPIWVGRGARQNDELTFRIARGGDVWLHARGVPGAHVVIPLARGAAPDEEALLDACALAVSSSGARGETVAEVAWTYAKHVRRAKGAPPGSVIVTQEKVIAYRDDPARLARLIGDGGGAA